MGRKGIIMTFEKTVERYLKSSENKVIRYIENEDQYAFTVDGNVIIIGDRDRAHKILDHVVGYEFSESDAIRAWLDNMNIHDDIRGYWYTGVTDDKRAKMIATEDAERYAFYDRRYDYLVNRELVSLVPVYGHDVILSYHSGFQTVVLPVRRGDPAAARASILRDTAEKKALKENDKAFKAAMSAPEKLLRKFIRLCARRAKIAYDVESGIISNGYAAAKSDLIKNDFIISVCKHDDIHNIRAFDLGHMESMFDLRKDATAVVNVVRVSDERKHVVYDLDGYRIRVSDDNEFMLKGSDVALYRTKEVCPWLYVFSYIDGVQFVTIGDIIRVGE